MKRGITLLELIASVAIIVILVGILTPVVSRARRSAQITSSVARLRQYHLALKLYQLDYGGDGLYGEPVVMSLPLEPFEIEGPVIPKNLWPSPCSLNPMFIDVPLQVHYIYRPFSPDFGNYSLEYKENSLLVYDVNCDDHNIPLRDPRFPHKGLGVLLSGQLINKTAKGAMHYSNEWWSTPQE
jgi:type II secretory pathway pseudopilin PulG